MRSAVDMVESSYKANPSLHSKKKSWFGSNQSRVTKRLWWWQVEELSK